MADILVQKDANNLIPKLGITSEQRTIWAQTFTIYDINADGSKSAPIGPGTLPPWEESSPAPTYQDPDTGKFFANGAELTALNSLVSGGGSRIVLGILGDSLMNRTHTTSALTGEPTYSASTGVASFAQTSHGHFTGMLCRITSTAGDCYDNLTLTRVDANTFSVNIGTGQSLGSGETWYISLLSAYHAEGPVTHLRPARPVIRGYCASGATAAEIRARLLPLALAGDASVIWLRAGTNDATGGAAAVAGVLADVTYMAQQIVASGKKLIISTLPPYGSTASGGAFTANMRAGIIELVRSMPGVYLIDEHQIGADPASATGSKRTGYEVSDNTHFTPLYAKLIGAKLQAILDTINPSVSPCPTSALDAYDATNNATSTQPFPTPTLITTSGGTNGSGATITATAIAANLTCYASGGFGAGSVTATVGTGAWGNGVGNYQQLVASPTADNDLLRITTRAAESTVAGLVTAGQRRKGVAHVRVTGLTGQAVLQSLLMYVVFTTAEGTFSTRVVDHNWGGASNTAAQITQADIDMDLESGDFIVPAGVTSLYIDLQLKFDAAGTAVTFQAGQFALPLVPSV